MESWRAASGRLPLCGVMSGGALPVVQLGFVEMRVQPSQGCPLEWAMAVAGVLGLAGGVGWLRFLVQARR